MHVGRGFTDFRHLPQISNFLFQCEIKRLCGLHAPPTDSTGRTFDERHVDSSLTLTVTSVRHLIRLRSADLSVSVLQASPWLLASNYHAIAGAAKHCTEVNTYRAYLDFLISFG